MMVYQHTFDVLQALKTNGVTPEWVQVGNEIPRGMLWPDGSTSNWNNLSALLNKGYDAVKAVDPSIKVVIHLDGGNHNGKFRTFFDNFKSHGGKWDVIGMSYYPFWDHKAHTETIRDLGLNLNDMAARYGKEVIVAETGGEFDKEQEALTCSWPSSNKWRRCPATKGSA